MNGKHVTTGWLLAVVMSLAITGNVSHVQADEAIKPEAVELGRPVDFNKDIAPIFRANCVACHNKTKAEGELSLESAATILKGSSSGEIVVSGKPDESYLYLVAARIEESYMPPMPNTVQAKTLTPKQVGLLRQWIIEGAKRSTDTSAAAVDWQPINSQLHAVYSLDVDPWGRFVAAGRAGNVAIYDLAAASNIQSLRDPALKDLSPQQQAHRDFVHAIAFHPSGEMIATSGYRVVKLWERDFAAASVLIQHGEPVRTAVTSPDRNRSAFQYESGKIMLSGSDVQKLQPVNAPPTVKLHAIGGADKPWSLVSTAEGKLTLLSPDGQSVASTSEPVNITAGAITAIGAVVVASDDGRLQRFTIDAEEQSFVAAESVPSDKGVIRTLIASGNVLACQRDKSTAVEIHNADNLQLTTTVNRSGGIQHFDISQNGERVVTVSPEGLAELWNAKDGKLITTLDSDVLAARRLKQAVRDKAVRDARVNVVKSQITEAEKRVKEQQDSLKKAEEAVKKANEALAAAKKKLTEETPKVAAAQKASTEKPDDDGLKKKLEAAQKAQTTAQDAVAAAERSLTSANKSVELTNQAIVRAEANVAEQKKRLTVAETEAKLSSDQHAQAVQKSMAKVVTTAATFVSDGVVASITRDGHVRLWKAADGAAVDAFPILNSTETTRPAIAVGQWLLVRQNDQTLAVQPFPQWKLKATLGPEGAESEFQDRVLALAFSPNGKILAAGGGEASRSGELTLWDVENRKLIRRIENAHSDTVCGIDISPDGKLLASASSDRFVKVFDLQTGEHVRNFEGHTHHVLDVAWKADGTRLASAGGDNTIKVWNAETGEQTRTISTYQKQVTALEFIGTSDEFLSSSGDKRIFRLRADNGGTVREFKGCPDYVYCSATSADGEIVAAGCEDGVVRIWNGKDGKILSTFQPN